MSETTHYEIGDVVNGHRWTGTEWQPVGPPPRAGFAIEATPPAEKPWFKKWWGMGLIAFGAVTIFGMAVGGGSTDAASGGTDDSVAAAEQLPSEQRSFLDAVAQGRAEYEQAPDNELAQKKVYLDRDAALCDVVGGSRFTDWVGTVEGVSESSGKAGLSVAVGEDSAVATWSNSLSDIGDDTMVGKGEVFDALLTLSPGDKVVVSGKFLDGSETCIRTSNLTTRGMMDSPDFVARFTQVRPA